MEPAPLQLSRNYTLDIVFCVDIGVAMEPSLPKLKEAMLTVCRRVAATMGKSRPVVRQRVRVITFNHTGHRSTEFFSFPEEAYDCETFIASLAASGQSSSLSGLLAFREAMHSDWERGRAPRHVQQISVFVGDSVLPEPIPNELSDELFETWGYRSSQRALMDNAAKRLCLFAPDQQPWTEISENYNNTIFFPMEVSEVDIEDILMGVSEDI
jgi:hypothetical protein